MKRLIIGFVTIAILPVDFKENLVKLFDDMGMTTQEYLRILRLLLRKLAQSYSDDRIKEHFAVFLL